MRNLLASLAIILVSVYIKIGKFLKEFDVYTDASFLLTILGFSEDLWILVTVLER